MNTEQKYEKLFNQIAEESGFSPDVASHMRKWLTTFGAINTAKEFGSSLEDFATMLKSVNTYSVLQHISRHADPDRDPYYVNEERATNSRNYTNFFNQLKEKALSSDYIMGTELLLAAPDTNIMQKAVLGRQLNLFGNNPPQPPSHGR